MPILKFHPNASIPTLGNSDIPGSYPYPAGTILTMNFDFWMPSFANDNNSTEIRDGGQGVKMEVTLTPAGEERGEFLIVEIQVKGSRPHKDILRIPLDKPNSFLTAILLEHNEHDFPFTDGQIVTVPLEVVRVDDDRETREQCGYLIPAGNEANEIILANVELFDG
jgi:hypothetical protein